MRFESKHWSLLTFKETEKEINPNPNYQRQSVWGIEQKQLLIDSIIREMDIPKIYLRKIDTPHKKKFKYEIIDGQQRMRTIWDFLNNKLPLAADADDILMDNKLYQISDMTYSELDSEVRNERIAKYDLDIELIQEATEAEIADLFFRLNNGTSLNSAEVRNAMPGKMKEFIKTMVKHPFFCKIKVSPKRYQHDQLMAQLMLLEIKKGSADASDKNITEMYSQYKNSIPKILVEKITSNFDLLNKAFKEKSSYLTKTETVNLYLVVSYLSENTNLNGRRINSFYKWFLDSYPKIQEDKDFRLYSSHAVNSRNSIYGRFKVYLSYLAPQYNELGIIDLDENRNFSNSQRKKIYARDKGICKKCNKPVSETNWHADHMTPWIKGGRTTIENGQLLCARCNLQKKDSLW